MILAMGGEIPKIPLWDLSAAMTVYSLMKVISF